MVDVKMWRRRRQPNHSDGRRAECPATAPRRGTQKRAPGGPETNLETEQEEQNMKKRLLSAALALAMVLTMLPLSVFATTAAGTAAVDGAAASYQAKNNANNEYAGAPGWFAQLKGTDGKVTGYEKITKGFIVNGKYYSTFPLNTANAPLSTTFTVVGAVDEADMQNATSVNVDVYGEGSSVTIKGAKLTSITVNDSKYQSEVAAGQRGADKLGSVTLDALASVGDRGVTLNLTNVKSNSAVILKGKNSTNNTPLANTITLTNATIGAVTMGADDCKNTAENHVYASQRLTANASNVAKAPGNKIGAITMVGSSGSQINLTDTALDNNTITLTGVGTSLIANGATTGTGKVTLIGSVDKKVTTGTAPSVTVNGHSLGAIEGDTANEQLTSNFTVTVNSAGTVSGINLKNANVTINGGKVSTTGTINVTTGSVKIQNGATVGDITFGEDGIISEFSVTGSRNTVGEVSVTNSNTFKTVNIVADSTNKFTSLTLGNYAGHGVHGGTYTTAIETDKEKAYLDTSLAYRVKLEGTTASYRYFPGTADGLSQAIAAAGKTNAESGEGIILVGQSNTKKITFQNGTTVLAKIGFSAPSSIIAPSVINGITYSNWTLTSNTNQTGTPIAGGQEFTRTEVEDITLDGQGVTGSVTKITNAVSAAGNNQDVTVKLVGNTVTLSGVAQPDAGDLAVFQVKLITDIVSSTNGSPVEVTVGVSWNSRTGKTTFANDVPLGYGITVSADGSTLTLKNGVKYTVNGSGLKKLVTTFKTHEDSTEIKVSSVTAPGYTTNNQKNLLIKELLSDTAKNSTFTWKANPEMRQAVNAAKATISESQVESWKTQAQRAAWSKISSKTPTEADLASTGYTDVKLVPYLNVTITKANPLTVTMAPYYRVEVWHTSDNDGTSTKNPPIEVQAGRALTGLNSMISSAAGKELKVKFAGSSATYAHQDGIYVYGMTAGEFTITHAGKTGLGTVELNNTAPVVTLTRVKDAKGPDGGTLAAEAKYHYDSLQAAVDDTLPQEKDKEDEISITSAYTGNGNINVAGQARIFKITTNGNTTITSNASGDVRVTAPASGSTYTIQLVKDVASATSTVSISVNTATGGSASVSSGSAKPGDTVTVTPRAVSGYKVSGVTAVTNTGASVPVKANSNGTYTFTVPANATKVTVTPRFVASENRIFPDVDPKSWYGPSVKYCYETTVRGVRLMEGDANGNFAPNAKLTRAQMVQMLYNLAGRPTVTGACPFPDVVGTGYDWAAAPITWAAQKGYVIGYSDGKFHPEVNVSRQDMVLILYRYAKQPAIGASGSLSGYYDASSVGSWAYDAVRWAASMGILSGTNSVALNGYINGPVRANRCEVAVTLANFHRLYG